MSKIPAFRAGVRGGLGDRVGRDAQDVSNIAHPPFPTQAGVRVAPLQGAGQSLSRRRPIVSLADDNSEDKTVKAPMSRVFRINRGDRTRASRVTMPTNSPG